jgi:hypothetical protein
MSVTMRRRDTNLLLVIGVILLVLWLVGFGSSYTLGGLIYVALVVGIVLVVVSLFARFRGRR